MAGAAVINTRREPQECAPYWNFRARWVLFYLGPLFLLGLEICYFGWLELGDRPLVALAELRWDGLNTRDFWVPMLWGFWMPWFNGPRSPVPGLRRIVFRDFNGNDMLPLAIPLMHGLIWAACSQLPVTPIGRPLVFAVAFLAYDILMLRFDLLQIYVSKFATRIGPKGVVRSFLTIWWLYLGTGLELVHQFGDDRPLAVLGAAALLIVPMQFVLLRIRRPPISVKAQRVAVIGAGWSGTYAAKWLLQAGLDVQVYERTGHIGGLWHYDERAPGTVSESTFASSSNYYMHASDFPMRTCSFPTHGQILDFINRYADHFGVREKVSFHTHVERVEKHAGKWILRGVQGHDGQSFEEAFDAVVVAGGFNEQPQVFDERYAGFAGEVLHSSRYKHVDSIGGHRRIVVVGLGESAADVAHECSQIRGAKVYMSGSGQQFAGRFINGNFAADTLMAPGIRTLMSPFLDFERRGRRIIQMLIGMLWGAGGSGVEAWGPPVPWLHGFVTKSRSAVEDVHEGKITAKTRIARCDKNTVTFEDGSTAEADLIIDCTGFAPRFPYLTKDYRFSEQYRLVFNREDPTLSFVGTARPVLGSIPALAEMQARFIAAVYSGRVRLPHPGEQEIDAFFTDRQRRKRFHTFAKRPNLVDHEFYAADIARDIGITVPWVQILLRHPRRFYELLLAPWMAFKYELRGLHGAQAMAHILEHMPKSPIYYNLMRGRFLKMAKYMWAIQGGVIVLSLICVPPYILATLAGFFAAHRLVRDRAARHARFA